MLHEAPCPLITLSNHHGSPKSTRVSNISYELSEDLRAKEIEFMERCYGGRIKAHRAARIIQLAYRKYRMKKNYWCIRSEQRLSRRIESIYHDSTPKQGRISPIEHVQSPLKENFDQPGGYEDLRNLNINRDSLESQNDTPNSSISSSNPGDLIKGKDFDQSLPSDSEVTSPGKSSGFVSNASPDTTASFSLNDSFEHSEGKTIQPYSYSPIHGGPQSTLTYSCKAPQSYERQKRIIYSPQKLHFSPTNQMVHHPNSFVYVSPTKNGHFVAVPAQVGHQFPIHKPVTFPDPKAQSENQNRKRKRFYRIGLNIFNKTPVKGIEYLVKLNFLEFTPQAIAKFLLTRRGLSRAAIGDYLGNSLDKMAPSVTKYFIGSIDFRGKEVDEALRILMSYFRTPGEAQKIQYVLTEFQSAYIHQNPDLFHARFRAEDTVLILSYAIVMLHTDMYNTKIKTQDRMTKEQFIRNLRQVDDKHDLDQNFVSSIFDRIQAEEMKVQTDHTDTVRSVEVNLTGPLRPRNLVLPQRRLVCFCSLFEVMDKNKRDKLGAHERDVFLFNDLLIITKRIQKKRKDYSVYSVKWCIELLGLHVVSFENQFYLNGIELVKNGYIPAASSSTSINSNTSISSTSSSAPVNICLNTKTPADKASFFSDLTECIAEVTEMDRIRISDGLVKMNSPQRSASQTNAHTPPKYAYRMPPSGDVIICNKVPAVPMGNYILIPTSSATNFGPYQQPAAQRGVRRYSGQQRI